MKQQNGTKALAAAQLGMHRAGSLPMHRASSPYSSAPALASSLPIRFGTGNTQHPRAGLTMASERWGVSGSSLALAGQRAGTAAVLAPKFGPHSVVYRAPGGGRRMFATDRDSVDELNEEFARVFGEKLSQDMPGGGIGGGGGGQGGGEISMEMLRGAGDGASRATPSQHGGPSRLEVAAMPARSEGLVLDDGGHSSGRPDRSDGFASIMVRVDGLEAEMKVTELEAKALRTLARRQNEEILILHRAYRTASLEDMFVHRCRELMEDLMPTDVRGLAAAVNQSMMRATDGKQRWGGGAQGGMHPKGDYTGWRGNGR